MSDSRKHRGRHPRDEALFAPAAHGVLRAAVAELSWLLSRGYAEVSALKLVGDRHGLRKRQRLAVLRSACSDAELAHRDAARVSIDDVAGRDVAVDGFNCIITTEAALAGGVVIVGRDGAARDVASVHGTYRRVAETGAAARALGEVLADAGPASITWYLDRPVSNSGRLKVVLAELCEERGWRWDIRLVDDPDRAIIDTGGVAASSDGWILDQAAAWVNLTGAAIARAVTAPWIVDTRVA